MLGFGKLLQPGVSSKTKGKTKFNKLAESVAYMGKRVFHE